MSMRVALRRGPRNPTIAARFIDLGVEEKGSEGVDEEETENGCHHDCDCHSREPV